VAVLGILGALTAVALVVLLRRFLPTWVAVLAASLYVVLPDHTSLEVWASASNISLAVLLLVVGLYLAVVHRRSWVGLVAGAVALAAAVLCYEAVGPVALIGVVALPWLSERRLDLHRAALQASSVAAAGVWILLHWNRDKPVAQEFSAVGQVVPAQLGWGIAPSGVWSTLLMVVAVVGSCLVVLSPTFRRAIRRVPQVRLMVVIGWVVMVLAVLPFLKYPYGPAGAGDRANCVAAIGGALIWAGLLWAVWEGSRSVDRRGRLGLVALALVVLLSGALVVRWQSARRWARAFGDADRILAATVHQIPDPTGPVALGPRPIQERNIAAFLDNSNVVSALQLAYGRRDVTGVITYSERDFELFPPDQRVDIRPLSNLGPMSRSRPSI
jgi:hypothetical protein